MKIYTASYFEPHNHHGRTIAISRSIPKDFTPDDRLSYLAPSANLLDHWKQHYDEQTYTDRYREEFKPNVKQFCNWIESQNEVVTLLCWEKQGEFCHRNLIAKFVQARYPDRFGGCDVRRLKIGDRINVYDFTPANPSQSEARQWTRDRINGIWWKPQPGEPHRKHRLWGNWETYVAGLNGDRVLVGSPEFPGGFTVDVAIEFCEYAGESPQKPVKEVETPNTSCATPSRASRGKKRGTEKTIGDGADRDTKEVVQQTLIA